MPFSLAHYDAMERELEARPDVRLVVIDPAGAYVGRAGVDDHKDSDLRSLLGPMAELAARRRVTIVLVKHLVKGATPRAVHKVSGSAGYVNAVRAAFLVAPDPQDEARKLLLPLKFNLGVKPSGLAYQLVSLDAAETGRVLAPFANLEAEDRIRLAEQLFRVEWKGEAGIDADQAVAEVGRQDRGPGKAQAAQDWLRNYLASGRKPSTEIMAAGKEEGFSRNVLFDAKAALDIRAHREGATGPWYWDSPPGHWDAGDGGENTEKITPITPSVPTVPSENGTPYIDSEVL